MKKTKSLVITCFSLFTLSGCIQLSNNQSVVNACQMPRTSPEQWLVGRGTNQYNTVSPSCARAIETAVEFDQASFQDPYAVVGLVKQRVLESIQILMSSPIKLDPSGRVFPTEFLWPESANPTGWLDRGVMCQVDPETSRGTPWACPSFFFSEQGTPSVSPYRQSVRLLDLFFAYTKKLRFVRNALAGNSFARSSLHNLSTTQSVISVTEVFAPMDGRNPVNTNRFLRTAILVHELGHALFGSHSACRVGPLAGREDCDEGLQSAYGLEMVYLAGLARASGENRTQTGVNAMTTEDLTAIRFEICRLVQERRVQSVPAGLGAYFDSRDCMNL